LRLLTRESCGNSFRISEALNRERGVLTTELVVAMSILVLAMFPMAYSRPRTMPRALYRRGGDRRRRNESLVAGEWRFQEGRPHRALKREEFRHALLTLAEKRLRPNGCRKPERRQDGREARLK
jgi:hypothetical protein